MLSACTLCFACERKQSAEDEAEKPAEKSMEQAADGQDADDTQGVVRAVARMKPTEGNKASGVVYFEPASDGVVVRATLTGLTPGSLHGFHIHEKGDCSAPDASSAGGHYAPEGHPHGLPPAEPRHAGDMGNVVADDEGSVKVERTFDSFALDGDNSVVGLAVIVHAKEDKGTQPTGAAGARIACGVIERDAEGIIETHVEEAAE
jgi:Cu-Zn family superoxide dismutase